MTNTHELTVADTVGYEEFAALAGLEVSSIRQYASSKQTRDQFPKPLDLPGARSPRWERKVAEQWTREREQAAAGRKAGRPPKSSAERIRLDDDQRIALKNRIKDAGIPVLAIANELGFSRRAIVQRLEGLSGWNKSELQTVARMLKVKYSDIVPSRSTK
ncbi:hypothetical protein [Agromyces bauzanensis]